jgi:hypothetical protein
MASVLSARTALFASSGSKTCTCLVLLCYKLLRQLKILGPAEYPSERWAWSRRRSRRSRTFIDWSGCPWSTSVRFEPSATAMIDGSARTGWAGIIKATPECCAISTLGKVAVDWKPLVHRQTGVVLHWRTQQGGVARRRMAHSAQPFPPQTCVREIDVDAED